MADALGCAEPGSYYTTDFHKETHFECNAFLKEDTPEAKSTQDENKCESIPVPKQTPSRKREASNVLMECVKRRENLQNISYICEVSSESYVSPSEAVANGVLPRENFKVIDKYCGVSSPVSVDLMDSSATDSGIDSSKSCSPEHSIDISSASDEENRLADDDIVKCAISSSLNEEVPFENTEKPEDSHVATNGVLSEQHLKENCNKALESVKVIRPPLTKSCFENVPSVIYFPAKNEEVSALPEEKLSLLKWKLSPITPIVIKDNVTNVKFTFLPADTTEDWLGTWGKHLKCLSFRKIKHFQKVNHYPGGYHLGRKDRLWENYKKMVAKHGSEAFHFFPHTFVLPGEMKQLKKAFEEEPAWIIKPCASARGTGVKVIYKWSQVPKDGPHIVQRYISDPYLINGSKFDLRMYVLVSSVEPLRVYLYEDGLVRFASRKYSLSNKSLKNRFIHLTNYSINRKSASYTSNNDESMCQGHKWSLKSFWIYMAESGIDVPKIKATILDVIIKTVIGTESPICRQMKIHAKSAYNCFELFGFDIMLDKNLHPWLLEVNISPSLHTRSVLDSVIKGPMVRDMLNIIGFELPETSSEESAEFGFLKGTGNRHKPLQAKILTDEERRKHSVYTFKHSDVISDILTTLTLDDLSCLMDSEDELLRSGNFTRVFPTATSHEYDSFFDHVRYYNILLDTWERTYAHRRQEGIEYLRRSYTQLQALPECCEDTTKPSAEVA